MVLKVKRYFKFAKPYIMFFILAPILMLVEVYSEVNIPVLAGEIINAFVEGEDQSVIFDYGIRMIGFVFLGMSGGIGCAFFATRASVYFGCDLREALFKKIQEFSFSNIDKFSTASLVTRLTNDIIQIQNLVETSLRMMFRAPGLLIGTLIMVFMVNSTLASIFLVLIPILVIAISIIITLSYKRFSILQKKIDRINSVVRENLTNIRVIKSFVREKTEVEKFSNANEELKTSGLKAFRVTMLQMPIMTLSVNVATIFILYVGGIGVMEGEILIGDISAFITYTTQLLMSLTMLAMVFISGSRAMACVKRVNEVFDTKIDISDDKSSELTVSKGDVEFRNVSFKYYQDSIEKVLSGINLKINSGETVGIIGSTGCGKTSLVSLIPRLYDICEGEVLVDGVNVKDYSLKNLRDSVGMVLQNNVLFSGTIEKNLLYGDKNASFEEVRNAAKSSAANDFIESFPEKYKTELGQGGVNLSGGQKQRLCIARALLKDPKILILDDSTSAVDTATETKIRNYLMNELNSTTKIIIAQRITSVIEADNIVVMNEGEIEAVGNHSELMKNCKTYQEIYNSQKDKESIA